MLKLSFEPAVLICSLLPEQDCLELSVVSCCSFLFLEAHVWQVLTVSTEFLMLWSVMLLTATAAKGSCPEVMSKQWLKTFLNNYKTPGSAVSIAFQGGSKPLKHSNCVIQFQIVPHRLRKVTGHNKFFEVIFSLGMNTTTHVSHSAYTEGVIIGSCLFFSFTFGKGSWKTCQLFPTCSLVGRC